MGEGSKGKGVAILRQGEGQGALRTDFKRGPIRKKRGLGKEKKKKPEEKRGQATVLP